MTDHTSTDIAKHTSFRKSIGYKSKPSHSPKKSNQRGKKLNTHQSPELSLFTTYEPCVHLHFKTELVDRDCLTHEQYLDMLATPKGYRWLGEADCQNPELVINKKKKKKKPKKGEPPIPRQDPVDFADEFVEDMWDVMSPEITDQFIDFLVNEFGMSIEEAEDFIDCKCATGKQTVCKKKKSKSIIGFGPKHKWVKELSDVFAKRIEQYIVSMLLRRRTPLGKRIAERVLDYLCDLTGVNTTLQNSKTKVQKTMVLFADRLALWIEDLLKDLDKPHIKRPSITEEEEIDKSEEEGEEEEKPAKEEKEKEELKPDEDKSTATKPEEKAKEKDDEEQKEEEKETDKDEKKTEEDAKTEEKTEEITEDTKTEEKTDEKQGEPAAEVKEEEGKTDEQKTEETKQDESKAEAKEEALTQEDQTVKQEVDDSKTDEKSDEVKREENLDETKTDEKQDDKLDESKKDEEPEQVPEGETSEEAKKDESKTDGEPEEVTEGVTSDESKAIEETTEDEKLEGEEITDTEKKTEVTEEEKEPEDIQVVDETRKTTSREEAIPSTEKLIKKPVLDYIKDDILGTVKDTKTDKHEVIKDAIDRRLEAMLSGKDYTQEDSDDIASRVAHWVEDILKATEPGREPRKSPGPAFVIKAPLGSTIEVKRLSSGTVAEATAQARGVTAPRRERKFPASTSPINLKSAQEWVDWATNVANVADEWGKWIDSKLTDVERQVVEKKKGSPEKDWKTWRDEAEHEAMKWRAEKERIRGEGKLWGKKMDKTKLEEKVNPEEPETEVRITDSF